MASQVVLVIKNLPANAGDTRDMGSISELGKFSGEGSGQPGKILWRRKWPVTPVFLLGKSHGQRNLVGYSPWVCKESDMTEQLSTQECTASYIKTGIFLPTQHKAKKVERFS